MPKYRKKVAIEAVQFAPAGEHRLALPEGVLCVGRTGGEDNYAYGGLEFHIQTLEGDLTVRAGDWVITGIEGEHYAIKPDIFEATYELVEDDDA